MRRTEVRPLQIATDHRRWNIARGGSVSLRAPATARGGLADENTFCFVKNAFWFAQNAVGVAAAAGLVCRSGGGPGGAVAGKHAIPGGTRQGHYDARCGAV